MYIAAYIAGRKSGHVAARTESGVGWGGGRGGKALTLYDRRFSYSSRVRPPPIPSVTIPYTATFCCFFRNGFDIELSVMDDGNSWRDFVLSYAFEFYEFIVYYCLLTLRKNLILVI